MAFCDKCGAQLNNASAFCSACGSPISSPNANNMSAIPSSSSFNSAGQINVVEALFRPFKAARWIQKVLLGGLISLIPLLGGIVVQGYSWIYCRRVISKNYDLPEWDDWGEMLSRGFGVLVIGICYGILPLIVALMLGLTGAGFISLIKDPSAVCGVCLIPVLALLVAMFICFFFYPLSLTSYAGEGKLGAAFDFSRFWNIINAHFVEYLMCYLALFAAFIVIMTATFLISVILVIIPCLGWIALILLGGASGLTIGLMATSTFGEFYSLRAK